MEEGFSVPLVMAGALLVASGVALLAFAPRVQRFALRLRRDRPGPIAARDRDPAASRPSVRGIQSAGAVLVLLGAVLLLLAARPT